MTTTSTLIVGKANADSQPMLLKVEDRWYFRNYTGDRGRGAAWQPVFDGIFPAADVPMAFHPITVAITERDLMLARAGSVTSIGTKAMKALESSNSVWPYGESAPTMKEAIIPTTSEAVSVKAEISTPQPVAAALLSVPDKKWADDYINRTIHGATDFDIMDSALANHENILIAGPAGSGKTICAMAYAASRGFNYYNIASHTGVDASQLFGRWVPTAEGTFRFQYGPVAEIVRDGGVLLINEVNFMPNAVKTALFSLLDYRREIQILDHEGEVIKAHPNLLVIADMNPNYRGTKPLNEAEKDRYAHKWEFPYDPTIEGKLIHSKELLSMADKLRGAFDREELMTPVSTRSLVAFQENTMRLGFEYAMYSFVNGFEDSERSAVRLAVETAKFNIMNDIQPFTEVK